MKVIKKLFVFVFTFSIIFTVFSFSSLACPSAEGSVTSRDDGVWLFPISSNYNIVITDWAGCNASGNDKGTCPFHGDESISCGASHKKGYGHSGIDIGGNISASTPVLAAATGKVRLSYEVASRGKTVVIEHEVDEGFSYYSYYQHLSSIAVKEGDDVYAGDTIGYVGNTGGDYAVHLHFAIIVDVPYKPSNLIFEHESQNKNSWLTDYSKPNGQVVVNPKNSSAFSYGCTGGKIHKGSVTYTFNANEVNINNIGVDVSNKEQQASIGIYSDIPSRDMAQGATGADVIWLKKRLYQLLVDDYGNMCAFVNGFPLSVYADVSALNFSDTRFDQNTMMCVALFQQEYGGCASSDSKGSYSSNTRRRMMEVLYSKRLLITPWHYSGNPTRALQYGATGSDVVWLQQSLNIVINANLDLDGSFGPATRNAVLNYQSRFGLSVDGSFGPSSRARMINELYARGLYW